MFHYETSTWSRKVSVSIRNSTAKTSLNSIQLMEIMKSTVLLFRAVEVSRKLSKLNIPYDKTHYTYVQNCKTNMQIIYTKHIKNDWQTRLLNLTCDCASSNKL